MDRHNKSFFGKQSAFILESPSKTDPYIFVRMLKVKSNGSWEKPSNKEGKVVKFSLEEMIMIHKTIIKENIEFKGFHSFTRKDQTQEKTSFSFKWEDERLQKIWINIGDYSKYLVSPQIELLELLLKHLIKEKIEFATLTKHKSNKKQTSSKRQTSEEAHQTDSDKDDDDLLEDIEQGYNDSAKLEKVEIIGKSEEQTRLMGMINGNTNKALLIDFGKGEGWIPKSTIHSTYNQNNKEKKQQFLVDTWILEKNSLI